MDALLAIKPEFAEKILSGEKRYEFRRTSFRSMQDIDFVYLYSSAPMKKIVGRFSSGRTIEADPEQLWDLYSDYAGVDREQFMKYFQGTKTGFAIQVDDTYRFEDPIDPNMVFEDFSAPMSILYLDEECSHALEEYLPSRLRRLQKTDLTQYSADSN
jgi:type I restriction enzyme S subunit